MNEAIFIAGAIFIHAGWTTPSREDDDVAIPVLMGILCLWIGILVWVLE